ncbi:unnamed protein product [Ectocarpus sp. 6 AP-2014]
MEKAMKIWLLEHPLFSTCNLNGTLAGAELLYASLFCKGDLDMARTGLPFKASSSLRGIRRFGFGYRLDAATLLCALAWAMWDCIADEYLGSGRDTTLPSRFTAGWGQNLGMEAFRRR